MLREKLRNRKGFTLIEIIVVIVVLAVLMAVAVPSVMSYLNEGNNAKFEAQARAVYVRVQTEYAKQYADNSTDPNSLTIGKSKFDEVDVSDITYTTTTTTSHNVDKVKCTIKIGEETKYVLIEANKKIHLADKQDDSSVALAKGVNVSIDENA